VGKLSVISYQWVSYQLSVGKLSVISYQWVNYQWGSYQWVSYQWGSYQLSDEKGSKRREKARKRVAKIHAKIKDNRTDFLNKLSPRVVRENQTIILGDLNTSGMVKNRKLSRAISDYSIRLLLKKQRPVKRQPLG